MQFRHFFNDLPNSLWREIFYVGHLNIEIKQRTINGTLHMQFNQFDISIDFLPIAGFKNCGFNETNAMHSIVDFNQSVQVNQLLIMQNISIVSLTSKLSHTISHRNAF